MAWKRGLAKGVDQVGDPIGCLPFVDAALTAVVVSLLLVFLHHHFTAVGGHLLSEGVSVLLGHFVPVCLLLSRFVCFLSHLFYASRVSV